MTLFVLEAHYVPMSKPNLSVVVPLVLISAVSVLAAAYAWLGMCLAFWGISMLVAPLVGVVLFVAQVFGMDLSLTQQVVLMMLSVLSAVAVAGIPGGSLPLIAGLLASFGVPPEGIGIVIGVEGERFGSR